MANTKGVRTTVEAELFAKNLLPRINKQRKKLNKAPLSQSQLIADAILHYSVEMGVEK
jgi:hypothetical protein